MKVEDWRKKELEKLYINVIIIEEETYVRIKEEIKKQKIYVFIGLNLKGYKEIIGVYTPEEETTGYWIKEIVGIKQRGVEEIFMISMINNKWIKKVIKMNYPEIIMAPSIVELYNKTGKYIARRDHRVIMREIGRIYRSKTKEEAEEIYINLKEIYKENKLIIMIIDKYIKEIFEMFKYSHEARKISSNTDSINKMRNRIRWQIQKISLFESIYELKTYLYEILKEEESKWYPSVKNWDRIINEMDCNLSEKNIRINIEIKEVEKMEEKILEMLMEKIEAGKTTYQDVNEMLNKLRQKMMQKLLDKEFEEHMKYKKGSHEEKKDDNRRNGKGATKTLKTTDGEYDVTMPRDRDGSFEPILVPKIKRIIEDLSEQITLLYAKGNSIRDIKDILKGIYRMRINEEFISEATSMVSEEVREWKNRPLKSIYTIIYMDCLYTNIREEGKSKKEAVYVALGINITGKKEIIGFWEGESESSSFWYGVLEEIKERGVKDILFLCTDGVSGFKEILEQAYLKIIHQRCIVHIIRNMTPCLPKKEMKMLCEDLKYIYKTNTIEEAEAGVQSFKEKYKANKILIKKLENNIESMLNLYNYSENIRKLIYTTNAIESVNSSLRKVTNGKGCFVSRDALEKVLYLRVKELSKKWNRSTKSNWAMILNELIELFGERVEKYIKI